jgi:hypothetical protein
LYSPAISWVIWNTISPHQKYSRWITCDITNNSFTSLRVFFPRTISLLNCPFNQRAIFHKSLLVLLESKNRKSTTSEISTQRLIPAFSRNWKIFRGNAFRSFPAFIFELNHHSFKISHSNQQKNWKRFLPSGKKYKKSVPFFLFWFESQEEIFYYIRIYSYITSY